MSEETNSPTSNPINDSTIQANRSRCATESLGQNRIAFCYRCYMASILDDGDDIDFLDSQGDREQEIIEYHLEQFLNQVEGDEESVSVIAKWEDGSFTFFPRVKNDMQAVFLAVHHAAMCNGIMLPIACSVSVQPYRGSCFDAQIDPNYLDTGEVLFENAIDFFCTGASDGR